MKVILKIAVSVLIVVFIGYGVFALINQKTSALNLNQYTASVVSENNNTITEDWNSIYGEITADLIASQFSSELLSNTLTVDIILQQYLNYYIGLTQFENFSDESMKDDVQTALKIYASAQDITKSALTELLAYTQNSQFELSEFDRMLNNTYDSYKAQLALLYAACLQAEDYVNKVVYSYESPLTIKTALLDVQLQLSNLVLNSEFGDITAVNFPLCNELISIRNKYGIFVAGINNGTSEEINIDKINFLQACKGFSYWTDYLTASDKVGMLSSVANFGNDAVQYGYAQTIHSYLTGTAY